MQLTQSQSYLSDGPRSALLTSDDLRQLSLGKTEVLRAICYPVRDASRRTISVRTTWDTKGGRSFSRSFKATSGAYDIANLSDKAKPSKMAGLRLTAAGPLPTGAGSHLAPADVLLWGAAA